MLHTKVRLAALAGCAVSVLVIAGCGAREPVEAPPASAAPGGGAAQTPELMGAPPAPEATPADGLLGGPAPATASEAAAPAPVVSSNPNLKTWRRPDGTLVTAMAPIANPKATRYAPRAVAAPARRGHAAPVPVAKPVAKPAVVAKAPAKPAVVAPAPAPVKPVVAAKPAIAPAKAPVVAAAAPAPAKPAPAQVAAKPLTKLEKLQAAVAPEATKGATLATAESLGQGKEGQVTLSLPATLGDLIKKQAAKLGLGKPAKKASAYADLQGQGYEITPNGRQTAEIKAGEPATFAWQVKPTADAKGPLKTDFGVELNGAKPAQGFTLGSISKQVAPIQEAAKEKTKGFKFATPSLPSLGKYETVDLPGVGKVPGKSLLGGALVLLALLILVAIARNAAASKARAERRRKFRTLTDYGRNEMEHDAPPASASVNYVNPMVAAAGGALAGAALATAVNHHDDHGHDHDAHGHDDHGHGHDDHDHGHDDHGQGHDDHGHDAHHVTAQTVSGHDHHDDHGHGHDDHAHGHDDHGHDDHHVAPTADTPALAVSGHDHHDDHGHDDHDHGHDDHGHGHDDHAGHHDDHGHHAHDHHKELEHAH
jgi:hypothetical protein